MTNQELRDFRDWYAGRHGRDPTSFSIFVTCLCGYFHTYPKAATALLKELRRLGFAKVKAGDVTIVQQ
jgi:hypothetical protein